MGRCITCFMHHVFVPTAQPGWTPHKHSAWLCVPAAWQCTERMSLQNAIAVPELNAAAAGQINQNT
jgi:hypothetical protein